MTRYTPDAKRGNPVPLQGKVSRIVRLLAGSSFPGAKSDVADSTETSFDVSEEAVTKALEAMRERSLYLPGELLSDPAWGMLLELLQAEVQDRRVSLSRLCTVSAVPASSAVRWLKALEREGLAVRRLDTEDTRNEFVELSPKGRAALRRYFHDVVQTR